MLSQSSRRRRLKVCRWVLAGALFCISRDSASQDIGTRAVVVERVDEGSAGQRAGILPGDVLTSWERAVAPPANPSAAHGQVTSPFDLDEIEIEQAPRGPVTLFGMRRGQPLTVTVPPGRWRIAARPAMSAETLEIYSSGRSAAAEGQVDAAVAAWRSAASAARDEKIGAWLLLQGGGALRDARRMTDAHAVVREALASAERAADRAAIAALLEAQAQIYDRQNDVARAEAAYGAALTTRQGSDAPNLGTAKVLADLAAMAIARQNVAAAEPQLREAVDLGRTLAPDSVILAQNLSRLGDLFRIRGLPSAEPLLREGANALERLAPDTADHAWSLNNLGNLLWRRGAVSEATALYDRARAVFERVEPTGSGMAGSLMGLGAIAFTRRRPAEAEPFFRRVLSIEERMAPQTARHAQVLNNLGAVLEARGNLSAAEDTLLGALAIHERIAPDSMNVAGTLHNIGIVCVRRGDTIRAEDYFRRSLALKERLTPGGLEVATTLEALANLNLERGDFEAAETLYQRALAISEQRAPGSFWVASILLNIGKVVVNGGDTAAALRRFEAARGLLEQVAPNGVEMANVLGELASLASSMGKAAEADRLATRALAITEQVSPGTADHASSLRRVGLLARDRGDLDQAATYYGRAIDAAEAQTTRLGGSAEARTAFTSVRRPIYIEYVDVLMALGHPTRAFDVLERSRARGLLMMLAERDLVLDDEIPSELKQQTRNLNDEYDRVQDSVARLDPTRDAAEVARLRASQRELQDKRTQLVAGVRAASPRLAALRYPRPLGLSEVQRTLDPGTAVLSYQIGEKTSRVFVVRRSHGDVPEPLLVLDIPIGEAALRDHVRTFLRQVERSADARNGSASGFVDVSRRLFGLLVAPAENAIASADRVLIVPDGPLHSLPFAALVRPSATADRSWQYFIEWKPLHTTLSATVYAELRKSTPAASGPPTLVAFGDPQYPGVTDAATAGADAEVRGMLRGGFTLAPLPATRTEVEALSRGFGDRATTYLGAEATEARAKSVGKAGYLHFATHGLLDARTPLNSALALAMPAVRRDGEENGLLQAWEIFEQVRVDADLVTLSACETALGAELAGEGLIGLTRAFHYAGARSVLASLWRVADDSTAELMTAVYTQMRSGATKDEALRRAQRKAIERPETAAPFHWAAFTLSGDWR